MTKIEDLQERINDLTESLENEVADNSRLRLEVDELENRQISKESVLSFLGKYIEESKLLEKPVILAEIRDKRIYIDYR